MEDFPTLYVAKREAWRAWLDTNFRSETEIWLVYPRKHTGKPCLLYNDAVEEALCFGWIDSTRRKLDDNHSMQRFTPRRPASSFSQSNRERLRWLLAQGLVHPSVERQARQVLAEPFDFPADILDILRREEGVWAFFSQCPPGYQRIRLAYIDDARRRPEVFQKRLNNLLRHCRAGKRIPGYGGIDKYYR